ncbi:GPI transamidase component Gpi16 [Aspergillus arachidicola]|uniref:GPI transamidase component Gpi16 n=1 Tax=Aspergillus arachidicola TaxID=656916 RepID=A0A2G7FGV7_9EURO|nr:GPI transamidase component Gpi16 [Aspergillus arachidicola]
MIVLSLLPLFLLVALSSLTYATSDYHESLTLQPLPQSSLLASFNFRSNASQESFDERNFRHFPRALGQILQHAHTKELHLRFTTGRWDAESWGSRPWYGVKEGNTGVELWAWIDAADDQEAFAKWITLTQSLSGLFCASLNFIDSTRTTRPVASFSLTGDHSASSNLHLLHGTLPGEVVCTENLTPFLKLLPCKGKAGVASLLDGHKLFDASWQNNPIPRPVPNDQLACDTSKPYHSDDTCYPLEKTSEGGWSLSEIFGRTVSGVCPLGDSQSSEETICLRVPNERGVAVSEGAVETRKPDGFTRCYTLQTSSAFDLVMPEQEATTHVPLDEPVLRAERTIVGHGVERGGMRIIFDNPSDTDAVDFMYFETLPWFLRPYVHTLQATITGRDGIRRQVPTSQLIKETFYRPAIDRERGTQLELALSVPAASTVTLTYDFEKAILRYTEYPPDANRGFNVAPAVIKLGGHENPIYMRTTSLLLPLPTPDFSMPYNVIILTSTVIALAFGSIFNLLVRRFVSAEEAAALTSQTLKGRLAGKVVAIRDRIKGKSAKVE